MYLLDTDHLIILQREQDPEFSRLRGAMNRHAPHDFFLSLVSFHEQILGAHTYLTQAKSRDQVVRGYQMLEMSFTDFHYFRVLPYDEPAAVLCDSLRKSVRIGTMDLRIAATALSNKLIVLTRNTVDFCKVPELTVEDWTLG